MSLEHELGTCQRVYLQSLQYFDQFLSVSKLALSIILKLHFCHVSLCYKLIHKLQNPSGNDKNALKLPRYHMIFTR